MALILALASGPVSAATIDVDGFFCKLIDAIEAANTDTAKGGCRAGSGADTLVLGPGSTHTLDSVYTDFRGPYVFGPTGLPVITSTVRIEGNGATIRREPTAPWFRILTVSSADLTLNGVTVTGGISIFDEQSGQGGGLAATHSTVAIVSSALSGNSGNNGGGVYANDSVVDITNSTLSGNSAYYDGGGVRAFNSTFTITKSTVSGNSARGSGGGTVFASGSVTITNSTFSDNSAGHAGGGVFISGGNSSVFADITNSTLSGNKASVYGGGVRVHVGPTDSAYVGISDSTISGNTAGWSGGGVSAVAYPGVDGTVAFNRSLVSGNTASGNPNHGTTGVSEIDATEGLYVGNDINFTADNYNLFGTDGDAGVAGFTPGATDIVPAVGVPLRAILNPNLADNGGPTLTHALVSGSPAIDA
ncbi:MAG: right-handed parallel beta-helix repeat-containing protein, partial [Gammaproteobacteria bacterium]|nr:right-handed parallel beta-helix repeat-containing protein [Gammaproteobacteria bacterium]